MSYTGNEHYDQFIQNLVSNGVYSNSDAVLQAGLRLLENQEIERQILRTKIEAARRLGGSNTPDQVAKSLGLTD